MTDFDVVIVGGGPVGLMLACELQLASVSVLVIERLAEPDLTSKAGAINIPTAEAFYRRGLLAPLLDAQKKHLSLLTEYARQRQLDQPGREVSGKFAWHFSGIAIDADKLDRTDPEFDGHGPAGGGALVPQQAIEALLESRARALNVDLRRGIEMIGFDASDSGVDVETSAGRFRAGWLVGCDGGRSLVRKLGGFEFVGTEPETTGHQARVGIADPDKLRAGWTRTKRGVYTNGPHPGRILTVEFDGPPPDREAPITLDDLQRGLRRASGVDVTLTDVYSNATRFSDHARQATTYRNGRVLLAGDAAHVHSPFGGQGLNLGIGDAMNLGWKLAAEVQGWAPPGLLDTYTTERHPVGAWVLNWTRAQMALMRMDQASAALADIFTELVELPDVATYMMKKVAGAWQRYDIAGTHPLIGRSAPDLVFDDGRRLGECGHDGRALLFDLKDSSSLRALASAWPDRLRVLSVNTKDDSSLNGLFVRPDGCVAWAADDDPDRADRVNLDGLETTLRTWLGPQSRS